VSALLELFLMIFEAYVLYVSNKTHMTVTSSQ